jgi:glutamate N-acetyltransferase / amino-acid N-acetyltransferase
LIILDERDTVMPVNLPLPQAHELRPIAGLDIAVVSAGIKKVGKRDLTLLRLAPGSSVGAVFTQNRFCAAPVQVCRAHLEALPGHGLGVQALLINTGNANAGTGETGLSHARESCAALARGLGLDPLQVLPFSTGVIMEPLPIEKILTSLPQAISTLGHSSWLDAANGIMTTDTQPKAYSQEVQVHGHRVSITGIAKGAGMIRPNMATMLGFVATDACIDPALMPALAKEIAQRSFNRITVDGDTSTNDSFVVMATHQAQHPVIKSWQDPEARVLFEALCEVGTQLAQAIIRDAEGATKFITVRVEQGASEEECLQVAYAIAHSPLVKTAFFASDPNLGRILAAVGYAGISDLEARRIELFLDDVHVVTQGGRHPQYQEAEGQAVMAKSEIEVRVLLGRGVCAQSVWTCDLSHDYVSINADYRS